MCDGSRFPWLADADQLRRCSWTLRVDCLASCQHLHKLLDTSGSGLQLLCASDPIEDGVPIRTRERLEHCLSSRIGDQGVREIFWNLHVRLPGVGSIPATILFGPLNLGFSRPMHSARGAQPLGDGDVPLRPRAPSVSGRESSPIRCVVTTLKLPIDPTKADRVVECRVVGERCRLRRPFLARTSHTPCDLEWWPFNQVRHSAVSATKSSGRSTASRYPVVLDCPTVQVSLPHRRRESPALRSRRTKRLAPRPGHVRAQSLPSFRPGRGSPIRNPRGHCQWRDRPCYANCRTRAAI